MSEVNILIPITEVGRVPIRFEIYNSTRKVGTLDINKKWASFRKGKCVNFKRIPLEKLPEAFDKFGK